MPDIHVAVVILVGGSVVDITWSWKERLRLLQCHISRKDQQYREGIYRSANCICLLVSPTKDPSSSQPFPWILHNQRCSATPAIPLKRSAMHQTASNHTAPWLSRVVGERWRSISANSVKAGQAMFITKSPSYHCFYNFAVRRVQMVCLYIMTYHSSQTQQWQLAVTRFPNCLGFLLSDFVISLTLHVIHSNRLLIFLHRLQC